MFVLAINEGSFCEMMNDNAKNERNEAIVFCTQLFLNSVRYFKKPTYHVSSLKYVKVRDGLGYLFIIVWLHQVLPV